MTWGRAGRTVAAAALCAGLGAEPAWAASPVSLQRDGTLEVAGRKLKCGSVRNVLDPRLPNLGVAAPGVLVMNPMLLGRQPEAVRLFVFHHECGHHHVGGNELAADCWAVRQGVREGWLASAGLAPICKSFGDGPARGRYPAGAERCAGLRACFAAATTALADERRSAPATTAAAPPPAVREAAYEAPQLVSGPTLVRTGSGRKPVTRRATRARATPRTPHLLP